MVKNSKGGNKAKQSSRNRLQQTHTARIADLLPSEDQCFAKVLKVNGGQRYVVLCDDGKERLGIARGKINRYVRIQIESLLLISTRDFQDQKCDVLHTFSNDEIKCLQANNAIPPALKYTASEVEESDICFGEEEEVSFEDL
jgi:translation initiation factor 1A